MELNLQWENFYLHVVFFAHNFSWSPGGVRAVHRVGVGHSCPHACKWGDLDVHSQWKQLICLGRKVGNSADHVEGPAHTLPGAAAWDRPAQCPVSKRSWRRSKWLEEHWGHVYKDENKAVVKVPPKYEPVLSGLCTGAFWARGIVSVLRAFASCQIPAIFLPQHSGAANQGKILYFTLSDLPHCMVHVFPIHDCCVPLHGGKVPEILVWCR